MLRTTLTLAFLLAGAVGTMVPSVPRQPSDLQTKLQAQVGGYSVNANDFLAALQEVARKFEIPLGVEWFKDEKTEQPVSRSWGNVSVKDIFDELARSEDGYEMVISNGLVHVRPASFHSGRQDFTALEIDTFDAHGVVIEGANRRLHELIAMTMVPTSPSSGPVGTAGSQLSSGGERLLTVHLSHATVRDVLDRLALASDRKIWVVTFVDGSTPTRFWRTRSLWSSEIPADDQQPVWDNFRWGDKIPADQK